MSIKNNYEKKNVTLKFNIPNDSIIIRKTHWRKIYRGWVDIFKW